MNQQYLKECFDYDPNTGVLTWKHRPKSHFNSDRYYRTVNSNFAGKVAGHPNPLHDNRVTVRLLGKMIKAARIIWEMHHGSIPEGMQIDHINGIPSDDRWHNLRLVTRHQNCQNRKTSSNSSIGLRGVAFCKSTGRYTARITVNGEDIWLGRHDTPEAAANAYKEASIKYYGKFSYYARPV